MSSKIINRLEKKSLSHNKEYEDLLIAELLCDSSKLQNVREIVKADHFNFLYTRYIFEAICSIADKGDPVELASVKEELKRKSVFDEIGGTSALTKFTEPISTTANVIKHAEKVAGYALSRKFQIALNNADISVRKEPNIDTILNEVMNISKVLDGHKTKQDDSLEHYGILVEDLIQQKIEPPKYIINPILHEGSIGIVYAQAGIGKTWFGESIALAATTKDLSKIGPWNVENRTGVVYIDGESSHFCLYDRFNRLLNNHKTCNPLFLISSAILYKQDFTIDLMNEKDRERVLIFFKRHDEYGLLIIDNLSCLASSLDILNTQQWAILNKWFLEFRWMDKAVLIVDHAGKDELRGPRGVSSKTDSLDFAIKLKKPDDWRSEDGARFIAEFTKNPRTLIKTSNISPFEMRFVGDETRIEWQTKETEISKKDNIVFMLLKGHMKNGEIANLFEVKPSYISKIKKQLEKDKIFDPKGGLTPKGSEMLKKYEMKFNPADE